MTTFASLFGGFGGADCGARDAGLELAWSIELDEAIAEVAHANLGHRVHVANILDCDPFDFDEVTVLHASPPCPNFSIANANGGETALDIALAGKVIAFMTTLKPRIFTLENVIAYRHSHSWRMIEAALMLADYWLHVEHVNAADYGVPQARKRMIVRAIRGDFVPYLPKPVPWVGWYAAIEDLLPTLPESRFADWQLARLPKLLASTLVGSGGYDGKVVTAQEKEPSFTVTANENQLVVRAFLMPGGGNTNFVETHPSKGCRYADQPAHTITATSKEGGAMPKAWLVDSTNARTDGSMTIRGDGEPAFTVTTGGPKHPMRALFDNDRVVSMTPRALARFQSFPDWYELPDNARLAAKGIGNAIPPLLYQRIIKPLVEGL